MNNPNLIIHIKKLTNAILNILQNPNELDSKVLVEFDHVKKGLKLDEEGEGLNSCFLVDLLGAK